MSYDTRVPSAGAGTDPHRCHLRLPASRRRRLGPKKRCISVWPRWPRRVGSNRPFELVARQAPWSARRHGPRRREDLRRARRTPGVLAVVGDRRSATTGSSSDPWPTPPGSPPSTTRRRTHPGRVHVPLPGGSLQEEPVVLVEYLARRGILFSGAVYDNSPVGRGYAESLSEACAAAPASTFTGQRLASRPWPKMSPPPSGRLRAGDPDEPRLPRARCGRPGRGPGRGG